MIALVMGWGATAWRFLKSPIGIRVAIAIGAVVAIGYAGHVVYGAGRKHERAECAKLAAKAEKRVAETKKKSDAITGKVETQHAQTVEKIRTVTKTLIKEVPYAVPSDPTRASLSVGFVRLHDAAATGVPALSDPAGRTDAEASGIGDADLARTIIPNYETCRISAETVKAWQSWATDQAALYNQTIGAQH